MTARFHFELQHRLSGGSARTGVLETGHGKALTPIFMPVATHAGVRGQHTQTLKDLEFPVLLANTYHLLLRPGVEVFEKFGGIHPFMNWNGAVLTDSGGYQIFSLPSHLKMSEHGAEFRSYVDGRRILLTPEASIATQRAIQSDIMMVLDHCLPAGATPKEVEAALELTQRWAVRSLEARGDSKQALFAIVQGGCVHELREQSARQLTALPFDGFAVGGVAVGEERALRDDIVRFTTALLPENKPRYLMGVGTPIDLLEGVRAGIDMFDCILPTAWAQQGGCFTERGKIDLRRGVYRLAKNPIEETCTCSTCRDYSRGYLHHLNKAGDFMAGTLIGIHNLAFYKRLMTRMREHILADTFETFYQQKKTDFRLSDDENPVVVQTPKRSRKPPEELGNYKIHRQNDHVSIAQRSSGEVMHSVSEPMAESERLYISQSRLRERLADGDQTPLVVWDVGLGAATNAMAAVLAYETLLEHGSEPAPLHLVSFENDLDSLRLAIRHTGLFKHLRHKAPHLLLHAGKWVSDDGGIQWTLLQGDFLEQLANAPAPDLIFFDPFSLKSDTALWTLKTFSEIAKRAVQGRTELFTYSNSTSVRAALLAAGFFVAKGTSTGPKSETTIALYGSPQKHSEREWLGREWLERWERSEQQMPLDIKTPNGEIAERIRNHPQFQVVA